MVGDQVSDQVSDQVNDQVKIEKKPLTKAQRDIVNFCSVPKTAAEILNRIGLTNHSVNCKKTYTTSFRYGASGND